MPTLWITIVEPPKECFGTTNITLVMETKKGYAAPVIKDASKAVFEVPFVMRSDRTGVPQPSGSAIHYHEDGRRFVYLAWHGTQNGKTGMFRRMKVYFDRIQGFPDDRDEYRVAVQGRDKKGNPSCATVAVITE